MSDELRAAALRLVQGHETCRGVGSPYKIGSKYDEQDDLIAVVDAYLAEHPADDNEPITREWLESIGFESVAGRFARGQLQLTNYDGQWNAWWAVSGFPHASSRLVDGHKTRGELLRLLAALGITARASGEGEG